MNKKFNEARSCSYKSDFYKCKTGCVAYYKGTILAIGWNTYKTNPLQAKYNRLRGFDVEKYNCSLHAEMMVITKIRYLDIDFSKVKLYIWRGTTRPLLAKPCVACEQAIRDLGIKSVYYTGNNSFIEEKYV